MEKEYSFEFAGTKEMFLDQLNQYRNNYQECFFFNDYIVKLVDDEIHFGVERVGHSGGYWFVPTITEHNDKITFHGTIQYVGPQRDKPTEEENKPKNWFNLICSWLLYVILLPIILVGFIALAACKIQEFFKRLFKKQSHPPHFFPRSTEQKLFDLMEKHLNCTRQ